MRVALRLSLGRRSFENSRLTQTRQPTLQAILTLAPSTPPNIGPMLLARCDARDILVCAVPLPEKALIQRIRAQTLRTRKIRIGIGDDCSVVRIPPGHEVLVTTDFSLEGVHFRREWHPADSVGHRCLTRGLSDIAAMGGEPISAFLSLGLPGALPQSWIDGFFKGLLALAMAQNITLAGGDTTESPSGILADIVVLGSVPRGDAVLRLTARAGDQIYVTGTLGGSAAALDQLLSGRKRALSPAKYQHHFFPTPRVAVGRILRKRKLASAMIDLSDGLSTDLSHICEESGVGARILRSSVPRAVVGPTGDPVDLEYALNGGDDYELLFTARPKVKVPSSIAGVRITRIGNITQSKQILLVDDHSSATELKAKGWEHFRRRK
jgi:thiamine-monophosphate kinase